MNQFGPAIVSIVILALYAANLTGHTRMLGEGDLKLMETCLTLVVGYWLGSSAGSARKTELSGGAN